MTHYLIAFCLYTFAMIGIFFIAFVVYKKTMSMNPAGSKSILKIEDALRLSQRKTIYILKCGNKRFLIASDTDKTTFLAELDHTQGIEEAFLEKQTDSRQIESYVGKQIDPRHSAQIEKYLQEVQALDNENKLTQSSLKGLAGQLSDTYTVKEDRDEYDNSVYKHTKSTIMKNILKELNFKSGTKEDRN